MSEFWSLLLVLILNMWTLTTADVDISCVLAEICILPCSFQPGTDPVVHWMKVEAGDTRVHSYYTAGDQLAHQSERFRGRTSLFKEQISRGNASLRMTGLQLQDQGRYKCFTSTFSGAKESFINLHVYAPVGNVDIEQVKNNITCRSEGISPEPKLCWSTSPPSTFQYVTEVQGAELQLHNISSTLTLSHSNDEFTFTFTCTVSSGTSTRRATLFKEVSASMDEFDVETTIHCAAFNSSFSALVWKFNHSHIIVTRAAADGSPEVSEEWRSQVKSVSRSGSLTLKKPAADREGVYTCELSVAEETLVTNTVLKKNKGASLSNGGIAAITIGIIVLLVAVIVVFLCLRRKGQCRNNRSSDGTTEETVQMNRVQTNTDS
ncbi:V-set domain-containing T-cell activation inhibitor 1-like [Paralichthys olivaceus]|uniref:V-set domain-containing T-cell activation inhibitor 1-like n=1 Tax=Paralichthys olivaceus TaxID=8255 RepID=UPI003751264D